MLRLQRLSSVRIPSAQGAAEVLTQYANDFEGYCRDILGIDPWGKQLEIGESVLVNPFTAVAACHASGKSYGAGALGNFWLDTREPSVVLLTAPTGRQVRKVLMREVRKLRNRAKRRLPGRILQDEVHIGDTRFLFGFSSDNPDAVQGLREAENVLIIMDEAPGVDEEVVESLETLLTSSTSRLLKQGNPTTTQGHYYDCFHKHKERWHCIHISAFDTPNVAAGKIVVKGLIEAGWVEDRRRKWGESSPQWKTRILGEFVTAAGDVVVPQEYVENAGKLWHTYRPDAEECLRILAADIGRSHDPTVVVLREDRRVQVLDSFNVDDIPSIAERIAGMICQHKVDRAHIDATGIGIGVFDELRKLQGAGKIPYDVELVDVVFSRSPQDPELYDRFIDEMAWALRQALDPTNPEHLVLDPNDTDTATQLTMRQWTLTDKGKIKVESKKALKQRLGSSPDRADAVMLTCLPYKELILR
ncbi:MAG: hypothetical protein ACYCW6_00295 [Candidatus Xenobia bacterium]